MLLHQGRFPRATIRPPEREGFIARLEAAGIFVIFGAFSAVSLVLISMRRLSGKGNPLETGW
ncbi:hypothetical protein [Azospirillum doebereinerae]